MLKDMMSGFGIKEKLEDLDALQMEIDEMDFTY